MVLATKILVRSLILDLIGTPNDIFALEDCDKKQDTRLKDRDGWGPQSAAKLFAAINARRTIALDRFIYALGIRHVGETTARVLARVYGSADDWVAAMTEAGEGPDSAAYLDLLGIDGIGEAAANAVVAFFERYAET